jgi:ElaB/YqjD/DUF883 family membrane-anchored ribosome-binding protein
MMSHRHILALVVTDTEKYWSMYNLLDECFAEPVNVLRRNARCVRQKFDLALHELRDKLSEAEEKIQEQGREIQELRQQRHVPEAQQRA